MHRLLLLAAFSLLSLAAFSQSRDTLRRATASGAITISHNGVSLVPTFSLGKPAAIFDAAIRKNRFSFEPQLAFAVENARPWYLLFWLRYKAIDKPKFKMGIGAHPSFIFATQPLSQNGVTKDYMTATQYTAWEAVPNYLISENLSVGAYYLGSRGYFSGSKFNHFLALNCNVSNVKLGEQLRLRFFPMVYYLRLEGQAGFYATSTLVLTRKNWPLAFSILANQKIQSDIPSDDFVWSLSLTYAF